MDLQRIFSNIKQYLAMRQLHKRNLGHIREGEPLSNLKDVRIVPSKTVIAYTYKKANNGIELGGLQRLLGELGVTGFFGVDKEVYDWFKKVHENPSRSFRSYGLDITKMSSKQPSFFQSGSISLCQVIDSMYSLVFEVNLNDKYLQRVEMIQKMANWKEKFQGNSLNVQSYISIYDPQMVRELAFRELEVEIVSQVNRVLDKYRIGEGTTTVFNCFAVECKQTAYETEKIIGFLNSLGVLTEHRTFIDTHSFISILPESKLANSGSHVFAKFSDPEQHQNKQEKHQGPLFITFLSVVQGCIEDAVRVKSTANKAISELAKLSLNSDRIRNQLKRLHEILNVSSRAKLQIELYSKETSDTHGLLKYLRLPKDKFRYINAREEMSLEKHIGKTVTQYTSDDTQRKIDYAMQSVGKQLEYYSIIKSISAQKKMTILSIVIVLLTIAQLFLFSAQSSSGEIESKCMLANAFDSVVAQTEHIINLLKSQLSGY